MIMNIYVRQRILNERDNPAASVSEAWLGVWLALTDVTDLFQKPTFCNSRYWQGSLHFNFFFTYIDVIEVYELVYVLSTESLRAKLNRKNNLSKKFQTTWNDRYLKLSQYKLLVAGLLILDSYYS